MLTEIGPNFIQTMAPVASELQPSGYGLGGFSYKTLDSEATDSSKANGKLIDWFNVQFYNGAPVTLLSKKTKCNKKGLTSSPRLGRRQHARRLPSHCQQRLRRQPRRARRPRQPLRWRQRLVSIVSVSKDNLISALKLRELLWRCHWLGVLGCWFGG